VTLAGRCFSSLAVLVVLVACTGPSPTAAPTPVPSQRAPTPTATLAPGARIATSLEDIAGTWAGIGAAADRMHQRFFTDGTHVLSRSLDSLNADPAVVGTCRFEGQHLVLTQTGGSGSLPSCGDREGRYEVHLLANGNITFVTVQETCPARRRSTAMEHQPVVEQ
jgi:hypothetical protein